METFEDLGTAIGTVPFDGEALIERAVVQGRRHERRRRIGIGAGALAVGALVVGSNIHSVGSHYTDGTAVGDQGTPPTGDRGGGQTRASSPLARRHLPRADLTDARLAERLPVPGTPAVASDRARVVLVIRTLDPDGSGPGSVSLALTAGPPLSKHEIAAADQKCHLVAHATALEACQPLADGWMFLTTGRPDTENAAGSALDRSARMIGKDGTIVTVRATNYVNQNDPTRPAPVLDLEHVKALATDPVWFEPAS